MHITEDLTWTTNTMSLSKKAQQRLHFLRRLKRASLPPPIRPTSTGGTIESVLTSCITVWYGKVVQQTARPYKVQWTQLQRSSVPLSHPSWTFSLHDAPAKPTASWRTHPPLPQSLPASTIRKTVPEHQSPLRQTAQQLFPPGCESPEPKSPPPPLKPHANPYLLKHGPDPPPLPPSLNTPNLTTPKKKNCMKLFILCNSKCATHRRVGLYKPPVVTHSPLCTRYISHTAVCTQSTKTYSTYNICMFTCSCTTNHLALFPSQLLTHNVSLCTCTVFMWSIHIVCIVSIFF